MIARMESMPAHHGLSGADRAAAAFLLLLMAAGSLMLWIAIPAGWLWVAGKITAEPAQHILLSIVGAPLAIIAWARFLFWLNRLYMRVTAGAGAVEAEEDEDDEPRWIRGPLEPLLVVTLLLALAALFVWFFVYAEDPGAWVF
jgi:hypothetical protein